MIDPNAPSLRRVAATCESSGAEIISSAGAIRALLDMRGPDHLIAGSLEAVRHELNRALSYLDEYERNQPSTFQKLGDVAAVVVSDALANTPAAARLVPRSVPLIGAGSNVTRVAVKSAGAMGVVTSRGDGPEAA